MKDAKIPVTTSLGCQMDLVNENNNKMDFEIVLEFIQCKIDITILLETEKKGNGIEIHIILYTFIWELTNMNSKAGVSILIHKSLENKLNLGNQ